MKISEFTSKIDAVCISRIPDENIEISGIYAGDLLSWVMSHAQESEAWITVLTNTNIVAVALLVGVSCVIIPESIPVEENTINRAIQENIILLSTKLNTYEICCRVPSL